MPKAAGELASVPAQGVARIDGRLALRRVSKREI
jgi:hypothetical protein